MTAYRGEVDQQVNVVWKRQDGMMHALNWIHCLCEESFAKVLVSLHLNHFHSLHPLGTAAGGRLSLMQGQNVQIKFLQISGVGCG